MLGKGINILKINFKLVFTMLILRNLKIVGYPLPIFTNNVLLYIFNTKLKLRLINYLFIYNENFGFLKKFKIKRPLVQGF
jgi:hypothetical protein